MKLTQAVVLAVAVADDKKVPPRHPLQRLARLTEFSAEILDEWFGFWKRKDAFKTRFEKTAQRMANSFERNDQKCGFYDPDLLPHGGPAPDRKRRELDLLEGERYNREDPAVGVKQITTGFRKWAERYIAGCNGQKKHQHHVKRFNHYYRVLSAALESQAP